MQTTFPGQKRHSGMQEMGETREPMARDCWKDANRLAHSYADKLKHDFWVLYAAKPHNAYDHAIVCGWEVIAKKPPCAMVGVLVFKWVHEDRRLVVETDLCLPYDVPLSPGELSKEGKDLLPSLAKAAVKSRSILLA